MVLKVAVKMGLTNDSPVFTGWMRMVLFLFPRNICEAGRANKAWSP